MNNYMPLMRQDSPMVDEMFDGSQMDVADSEDSACAMMTGPSSNSGASTSASGHASTSSSATWASGPTSGTGGPASSLLSELANSDRTVHAEFHNKFGDLFNDRDLD
ncbi:hypothetical protein TCAL_14291 [Tigriopus californicus]|uniref:Uncharacterized protein n=1 Tax=Tigriopus californicus TaxID=6832 RepID=A0A553NC62_TIGCA|nr:uncharacterized protein LOC131889358 [Tigriopus californicus]TRY63031.1 hypothetical protein TCAL_14291 [Tigriopus californicus]